LGSRDEPRDDLTMIVHRELAALAGENDSVTA
jgi:hypothetical protein